MQNVLPKNKNIHTKRENKVILKLNTGIICKKTLINAVTTKKGIIIKCLDPLRAKKTFIRKKLGHTAVPAIKASIQ